jgi:hypothetical protein
MKPIESKVHAFFQAYARRFNDGLHGKKPDIKGTAASFAEYFVEASAVGVMGGKNGRRFRDAIPKGYEFYQSIGTLSMSIEGIDITELDAQHVMARVHWKAVYKKPAQLDFDVIYLLQDRPEGLKIFAYVTGDEQKVLRENGLMPSA